MICDCFGVPRHSEQSITDSYVVQVHQAREQEVQDTLQGQQAYSCCVLVIQIHAA